MFRYVCFIVMLCLVLNMSSTMNASAESQTATKEDIVQLRMDAYLTFQDLLVPWYYVAAIDQYERNIQDVRTDIPKSEGIIAIQFSDEDWSGILNPTKNDTFPTSIKFFGGMGLDGNGDGHADKNNGVDVLFTMTKYLSQYGHNEEEFKLALWDYYKDEQIVNQIIMIAKLYQKFETIDLDTHTFPVATNYEFSYSDTWGANRGWGGRRSHEGTDIYASYGTPILSASFGVVEVMGWNQFGGWRIGIRDNHNSYHYYAHLESFEKGLQEGDIVKAGQVIGYLGSSGYGKEGTTGKFPPHLHYGIYKFNGLTEWAFNPYPVLVQWEKEAKNEKKQ